MKYESVASNRKSPGCLMLRRLVTKLNFALPAVAYVDLRTPHKGGSIRVLSELESYYYEHLRNGTAPAVKTQARQT